MKCPDCGAPITDDSRFCNHCGAKLDDGVKRMEVNINKRIEDVAEMKRADYEEKESKLRLKQEERKIKQNKAKHLVCYILLIIGVIGIAIMRLFPEAKGNWALFIALLPFIGAFALFFIVWELFKGRW